MAIIKRSLWSAPAERSGDGALDFRIARSRNFGKAQLSSLVTIAILGAASVTATALMRRGAGEAYTNGTRYDRVLAATFTVSNTNDLGAGSLRQAILDNNTTPGSNTISFNIPGGGVHTITPATPLPPITNPVLIDGYTQTGASANTLPNGDNAVILIELNGSTLGGGNGLSISSSNCTVRGLAIGGFFAQVVVLSGSGNVIGGNFVGTDATGTNVVAGSNLGVETVAPNNTIGGLTPADRNVIGTFSNGVEIGAAATGTTILGNFIGIDRTGTHGFGINNSGVHDNGADSVTIGGTASGARNVISGSSGDGLALNGSNLVVQGNFIGTDVTGTVAIGNNQGVSVGGNNNLIGGSTVAARNVISGNRNRGIGCGGNVSGNMIQGNYIGVDVTGANALGNGNEGISLFANTPHNNLIGGITNTPGTPPGNIISNNAVTGINLNGTNNNLIQGNTIGADVTGTVHMGNAFDGVSIVGGSTGNIVGGTATGSGNLIAFNGTGINQAAGVVVTGSTTMNNSILGNSILGNSRLGIDLNGDGVTANNHCNTAPGPNNLQNYPVITSATSIGGNTNIQGSLDSKANTQFRIEFFDNNACDPSGNGQGQRFIGSTNVTTDGSCNAPINANLSVSLQTGHVITATATDPNGNTSEFSACRQVIGAPTLQFSSATYSVNEGCVSVTITVTRSGDTSSPVTVDWATSDGTALQRTNYTIGSGTVSFAAGETSKTFLVLITKDAYRENPNVALNLTLSNPTGSASLGSPSTATVTIIDDTTVPTNSQPIDDPTTFVCQHYHDFLGREPDAGGLAYWSGQITQCGSNQTCINGKRIDVSNAFFYELEYQQTAAYVFRLYRAAYGNNQPFPNPDNSNPPEANKLPSYAVFARDRARLIGSSNLAQDQLTLATLFASRPEFLNKYPANQTLSEFVDAVLATIQAADSVGLSSQRSLLIALGSRGAVIYRLANDDLSGGNGGINNRLFIDAEYNRAFVASQYFGYLRRDADIGGFLFWLGQVGNCPLRNVGAQHAMVCSFLTSDEFQNRFSALVTHTNQECPQGIVCSQ